MLKRFLLIGLLALAACGTTPEVVQPTSVPATPTLEAPTVVPTPIPLEKVDLVALLRGGSSLPKGITAGEPKAGIAENESTAFPGTKLNSAHLPLLHGTDAAGNVTIAVYDQESAINDIFLKQKVFFSMAENLSTDKSEVIPDLGKQAIAMTFTSVMPGTTLNFTRCRAFVMIQMNGDLVDNKTVAIYARDLDAKLTEAICR